MSKSMYMGLSIPHDVKDLETLEMPFNGVANGKDIKEIELVNNSDKFLKSGSYYILKLSGGVVGDDKLTAVITDAREWRYE